MRISRSPPEELEELEELDELDEGPVEAAKEYSGGGAGVVGTGTETYGMDRGSEREKGSLEKEPDEVEEVAEAEGRSIRS